MTIPTEHDYIEKCKHLIECRLEWKESRGWKNRDYEYLAELISVKTKVVISVSTLKRIWQNDRTRTPHVSTLNALAVFLEYDNWNDFKTKLRDEIKPDHSISVKNRKKRPGHVGFIILTVVGIALLLYAVSSRQHLFRLRQNNDVNADTSSVVFTSKKTITSGLPNTVLFNYDLSGIDFDSAFIQQDWDARRRAKITKDGHYHNCIYYYPGYYTAKLVVNDQIVKEHPLFITTDGWMAVYEKEFMQEVPIYLKNIDLYKHMGLHVSVDDLETNKIQNDKDFYIGLYNARDFGAVYCDSFTFETVVRNDPKEGGLTCQYAAITVEAERGMMTTSFSDRGCTSKLFLMFGEQYIDGSKTDLTSFGNNMTSWRKIRYEVIGKHVKIFLDGRKIYELSFERDMGRIINISYLFYGCGAVQQVQLWDRDNNLVYQEDFRQKNYSQLLNMVRK